MEKIEPPKKPTTKKTISIIMIVAAVVIFALGYIFYVKPASDLSAELNQQDILTLEVRLGEKETRLFSAKKLAKSYKNPSEETLAKLNEALPKAPGEVDLVVNINQLVEQSGIKLKSIDISIPEEKVLPQALQAASSPSTPKVKEVLIRLGLDGVSYTHLKRFIRNIETNSRLLRMDKLIINPSNSNYNVDLIAYYLED